MTKYPPIVVDTVADNEGTGHSFAATLQDARMPADNATREIFHAIERAMFLNYVTERFTPDEANARSKVRYVAVLGDDEGMVVYLTTKRSMTAQGARRVLIKMFESFGGHVENHLVNTHRFNAVDQARLEAMGRTNQTPKNSFARIRDNSPPKTKDKLKDYVDENSDDYEEYAPLGLADAPASSWETRPALALTAGTEAEESLAERTTTRLELSTPGTNSSRRSGRSRRSWPRSTPRSCSGDGFITVLLPSSICKCARKRRRFRSTRSRKSRTRRGE